MQQAGLSHVRLGRRGLVQAGALGLLGLGTSHVRALRGADRTESRPGAGRAKSVLFLFLSGGLSQHDSFDPKPEAPAEIRGEFAAIDTDSPGMTVCEHLPLLASRSRLFNVVRSVTSPHNGHSEGHMAFLSGRTPLPVGFNGSKPQRGDWPSMAAVAGALLGPTANNLPPAAVLPERLIHREGRIIPGQFAGQMGPRHEPWFIEAAPFNPKSYGAWPDYEFHFVRGREQNPKLKFQAPNLALPDGLSLGRLTNREDLLTELEGERRRLEGQASAGGFDSDRQAAVSLLTDSALRGAFDVHAADPATQDRYGRNAFGWSVLMGRRLLEAGVPLVQVNVGNDETWDTHDNNFPLLKDCLLPPLDRAVSALLDDLHHSGQLAETLVVMLGEMGRTPKVQTTNRSPGAKAGRDHWGAVQSVLLAGGGFPGGAVIGASDRQGAFPAADPQTPENVAATIYHALGIPQTAAWHDELDRPHHVYHGEPIQAG